MLYKKINFKNFSIPANDKIVKKDLKRFLGSKGELLKSLSKNYTNRYTNKLIKKLNKFKNINIIGMGGSILGSKAIHDFLNIKVKKKFIFVKNLKQEKIIKNDKKNLNLIISKSGNTLETLTNIEIYLKRNDVNLFITENTDNKLKKLAQKLKSDVVEHNNFIGGRYSVLSEVGMLPAELMGLKSAKFKNYNQLVNNNFFINNLVKNVSRTLKLYKSGKHISIILNYDEKSDGLFKWYQQLIAESLGKKSHGILPIISTMPMDNHSLMQLYLDGPKKFFYTFFQVLQKGTINSKAQKILYSQKLATENVFKRKNIPFRSFEVLERREGVIGTLFSFFILETILIGRALNVNPFDQPSVELIKDETKKLIR